MMNPLARQGFRDMSALCAKVKRDIAARRFQEARRLTCQAMCDEPDAPQPHNLMGLWLEARGDQLGAMKHYRAACDLDPTYRPAAANLDRLGRLDGEGQPAYAPEDVLSRPRAIRRWAQ